LQSAYVPTIALWPGISLKKVKNVISRANCQSICTFEEFQISNEITLSAVFIDGNSINNRNPLPFDNSIPIVLLFDKPLENAQNKEYFSNVLKNYSVTILGYHSSSPYRLVEDGFDKILNNINRPIKDIWLKSEKMNFLNNHNIRERI
ncbi:hypothetical protein PMAYCL1PPCAC_32494, partial [Pristionchus mayeri]